MDRKCIHHQDSCDLKRIYVTPDFAKSVFNKLLKATMFFVTNKNNFNIIISASIDDTLYSNFYWFCKYAFPRVLFFDIKIGFAIKGSFLRECGISEINVGHYCCALDKFEWCGSLLCTCNRWAYVLCVILFVFLHR